MSGKCLSIKVKSRVCGCIISTSLNIYKYWWDGMQLKVNKKKEQVRHTSSVTGLTSPPSKDFWIALESCLLVFKVTATSLSTSVTSKSGGCSYVLCSSWIGSWCPACNWYCSEYAVVSLVEIGTTSYKYQHNSKTSVFSLWCLIICKDI